ncbi:MAG: hypothetical protein LC122_04030, partial [Chitinophagales bacterium]|nr:hypothetical protein [Chitinophagales bacterium]
KNKRTKFVKTNKEQIELNEGLINKTSKLLGLKDYYTDLIFKGKMANNVTEFLSKLNLPH